MSKQRPTFPNGYKKEKNKITEINRFYGRKIDDNLVQPPLPNQGSGFTNKTEIKEIYLVYGFYKYKTCDEVPYTDKYGNSGYEPYEYPEIEEIVPTMFLSEEDAIVYKKALEEKIKKEEGKGTWDKRNIEFDIHIAKYDNNKNKDIIRNEEYSKYNY